MIAYVAISGNKYCRGNTFSCFLGLKIFFWGSLHSKSLYGLELLSLTITGNTFVMATLIFVSCTYKHFYGLFAFHTPAQIGDN